MTQSTLQWLAGPCPLLNLEETWQWSSVMQLIPLVGKIAIVVIVQVGKTASMTIVQTLAYASRYITAPVWITVGVGILVTAGIAGSQLMAQGVADPAISHSAFVQAPLNQALHSQKTETEAVSLLSTQTDYSFIPRRDPFAELSMPGHNAYFSPVGNIVAPGDS